MTMASHASRRGAAPSAHTCGLVLPTKLCLGCLVEGVGGTAVARPCSPAYAAVKPGNIKLIACPTSRARVWAGEGVVVVGALQWEGRRSLPLPVGRRPCVFVWWVGVYSRRGFSRVIGFGAQGRIVSLGGPCSVVAEWDTLILRGKEES